MNALINNTNETEASEQSNHEQTRFFFMSFYIVQMIVNIWLIISLIHYGIKTKKWRRLQSDNPNTLSTRWIYLSVIICSVATFFHHIFVAVYRNVGFHQSEDKLCSWIFDMVVITYCSCFLSVTFFLWFRQRTLYTSFISAAHFTKPLKFFSFIIIFVSMALGIIGLISWIVISHNIASQNGCTFKNNRNSKLLTFVFSASFIIFSQISLLIMFIHALFAIQNLDKKNRWKAFFCCKPQPLNEHTREQPADRTRTIVGKIIRKATFFATLSLLSDLLVISLTLLYSRQGNRHEIISVLGSLSVSMNLYFVILSFITWKDMITSPCKSFITGSQIES